MKHTLQSSFAIFALISSTGFANVKDASIPPQPSDFSMVGAMATRAESSFKSTCVLCHGQGGKGNGIGAPKDAPPPDFTKKSEMAGRSDWRLFSVIKDGGAKAKLSPLMVAYSSNFSESQIKDLVAYIRSLSKK